MSTNFVPKLQNEGGNGLKFHSMCDLKFGGTLCWYILRIRLAFLQKAEYKDL